MAQGEMPVLLCWVGYQIGEEGGTISSAKFADGVTFYRLVEAVCDVNIRECIPEPNTTRQKERNMQSTLKFIKLTIDMEGLRIEPKDILSYSSNKLHPLLKKLFYFSLSKKLQNNPQLGDVKDPSTRFKLWISSTLHPQKTIYNFTSDWCCGTALGALIEHIMPGGCPDWRQMQAAQKQDNITTLMDIAEHRLGIRKLIKPADMCDPGEATQLHKVMYLSQFLDIHNPRHLSRNMSVPEGLVHQPQVGLHMTSPRVFTPGIPSPQDYQFYQPLQQQPRPLFNPPPQQFNPHGVYVETGGIGMPTGITVEAKYQPNLRGQSEPVDHSRRDAVIAEQERSKTSPPDYKPDLTKKRFKKPKDEADFWHQMDQNGVTYCHKLRSLVKIGELTLAEELGTGAFGRVCRGRFADPKEGYKIVAAKTISVGDGTTLKMVQDFLNEAKIMQSFNHENVIQIQAFTFKDHLPYILLPLMLNRDLHTYLNEKRRFQSYDPIELFQYARGVARGMEYITDSGFVHRDLAARNCLISEDRIVKVGDFGFTRDVLSGAYKMSNTQQNLPICWMAYELLDTNIERSFNVTTDVWAYGVVLWEIYSLGERPYMHLNDEKQIKHMLERNQHLERPEIASYKMYEVMTKCWAKEPQVRPKFKEIVDMLERIFQEKEYLTVSGVSQRPMMPTPKQSKSQDDETIPKMLANSHTTEVDSRYTKNPGRAFHQTVPDEYLSTKARAESQTIPKQFLPTNAALVSNRHQAASARQPNRISQEEEVYYEDVQDDTYEDVDTLTRESVKPPALYENYMVTDDRPLKKTSPLEKELKRLVQSLKVKK